MADERHRALSLFFVTYPSRHVYWLEPCQRLVAAVLVLSVDAWYLALHIERRPVAAAVHATDRLVERAVAVVVLAALDVARRDAIRAQAAQDTPSRDVLNPMYASPSSTTGA